MFDGALSGWALMAWVESEPWLALLIHLAASALFASVLVSAVAKTHACGLSGWLFMFVLMLFMPFIAPIGLALLALPALAWPRRQNQPGQETYRRISTPTAMPMPQAEQRAAARAATELESILCHSRTAKRRLSAVLDTTYLDDADAVPLLRKALRDPEDDVRLLAYALLERKEQTFADHVAGLKHSLEAEGFPRARAYRSRQLAQGYLDYIESGLVQESLVPHYLAKVQLCLEAALKHHFRNPVLHVIEARLLLLQLDPGGAGRALARAAYFGAASAELAALDAEIDLQARKAQQWSGSSLLRQKRVAGLEY